MIMKVVSSFAKVDDFVIVYTICFSFFLDSLSFFV